MKTFLTFLFIPVLAFADLGSDGPPRPLTWVTLSGKPTTFVFSDATYANPAWISSLAWSKITGAPTVDLSGYVPITRTVNSQPLSGNVVLTKNDLGLGNVDNTSDAAKPVSTAQAAANAVVASAAASDATTKANAAQAAAVQRGNHTGTQSADTLTDGTTNKAFLATERTKLAAITGTNTGDQTLPTATTISGATTIGSNLLTLANPSAVTFLRVNADNSVTPLTAAQMLNAISALSNSLTKAQLNTVVSDADLASSGANADITSLTAVTSIASTGALALTAAVNQNLTLGTSGTGSVVVSAIGRKDAAAAYLAFGGGFSYYSSNGANASVEFGSFVNAANSFMVTRSNGVFGFTNSATSAQATVDTGFGRNAAGVIETNNGTAGGTGHFKANGWIKHGLVTVANLISASTSGVGARIEVSDATSATAGGTVVGGGSTLVMVRSNGTNWIVQGQVY